MKTNREKYKDAFKVLHTSEHFHVEVESMKESRKTAFGFMAKRTLIATCIVMLSVFGVTAGNGFFAKDAQSFVLVVNAADDSTKDELHIGEKLAINPGIGGHSIGTDEHDSGYYCINIPIKFEGEHIKNIDYSVNKGGFQIVEKKGKSNIAEGNEIDVINAGQNGGGPGSEVKYYSNFTLDYNLQSSETIWINIAREGIPLSDGGDFISAEDPTIQDLEKHYQELLDGVVITCGVNFDDGTTETVDMKMGCAIDDNKNHKFTLERVN